MLDIPETVKNLFDQDSIRKNFRAVFDSGLVVTNANITWNSLRFRESVCSADSVTFGAAEASVLNFETRGVRNMLGEWFDAWMEVDASTLPSELQTEREDLDYPVYPVPLGRFVVTACPRNHEAMAKRKVTAMSNLDNDLATASGGLYALTNQPWKRSVSGTYSINIKTDLLPDIFGFTTPGAWVDELQKTSAWDEYDRSTSYSAEVTVGLGTKTILRHGTGTSSVPMRFVQLNMLPTYSTLLDKIKNGYLFAFDYPGPADAVDIDSIAAQLWSQVYGSYSNLRLDTVRNNTVIETKPATRDNTISHLKAWLDETQPFTPYFSYGGGVKFAMLNPSPYGMPLVYNQKSDNIPYIWRAAYGVKAEASPSSPIMAVSSSFVAQHPTLIGTLKSRAPGNAGYSILMTADKSGTGTYYFNGQDNLVRLANAMIELQGAFGCFSRATGQKYLKQLDQEPVMRISRSQLSSAWWDEFDLAPVGSIAYRLGGEDYVYAFGEGQSQYVFQSSDIFDMIQNCTTDMVQAMMDEHLVPALQNLTFTPAEIDSLGLPYLESGDCIELEAEDGSIIKTYVLEREMHGTQHLTDRIAADGITITEVDL